MKKSFLFRVLTVCMAAVLLMSIPVSAATPETVHPYASTHISQYTAAASRPSGGTVKVEFSVMSFGVMTKLGAKSIKIYQSYDSNNWSLVKTFTSASTATMLGANTWTHSASVSYSGYVGVYYKAYIQFYAQNSKGEESIYYWTSPVV